MISNVFLRSVISARKLLILDWDDTVFPTTEFLANNRKWNWMNPSEEYESGLKRLVEIVQSHIPVVIITNATKSWIEDSSTKHVLLRKLVSLSLVLSAQDLFSRDYPLGDNPTEETLFMWKTKTMDMLLTNIFEANEFYHHKLCFPLCVLTIGDQRWDVEAVRAAFKRHECSGKVKSIQLVSLRTIENMGKDLSKLTNNRYWKQLWSNDKETSNHFNHS